MAATDNSKQDTKQEIIAILKEADTLLSKSHGWTRLALCRNKDKRPVLISDPQAQAFCLSGSVLRAGLNRKSADGPVRTALNVLSKLCRILYGKGIQKYGTADDFNEFKRFTLAYTNDGLLKSPLEARKILQDAIQSLSRKSVSEMGGDEDNANASAAADGNKAAAAPAVAAAGIPAGEVSRSEAQTLVADNSDYEDDDEDEDEDDAGAANVAAPPAIPAPDAPSPDAADDANTLMHISEQPVELDPKKPVGLDHTDNKDIDMPDLDLDLLNDDEEEEDE